MINPDDFIISRKRKKYRFAKFANATNCFELDEWKVDKPNLSNLTVEVGAGTAFFMVEMAKKYPNRNFVALDVKADRLQNGAYRAIEENVKNIWFVRARADQLMDVVGPATVDNIWLTFSDPFPKDRDAKRRLSAPRFLELYKNALQPRGLLFQKTDDHSLFDWSLEQLVMGRWQVEQLSFDLHDSDLSQDYRIMTTYEQKWLDIGRKTFFVSAKRPKS